MLNKLIMILFKIKIHISEIPHKELKSFIEVENNVLKNTDISDN